MPRTSPLRAVVVRRLVSTLTGVLLAAPASARADGWVKQPNGEWGFETSYFASGFFGCNRSTGILGGTCTSSGNTLTLSDGTSSLTLTWFGVPLTPIVATGRGQVVSLGSIQQTVSGPVPFALPYTQLLRESLFHIGVLVHEAPLGAGLGIEVYNPTPGMTTLPFQNTFWDPVMLSLTPAPGVNYRYLVFDGIRVSTTAFTETNATFDVTMVIGVAPEPGTWVLLGTGLAVLGGVAYRRRRMAS